MNEASEEKRFISMLSDYGFKVTFGNEHHPRFLRRALQALIASDTPIRSVQFSKNEITATTRQARGGLLDVTCEDERGQVFLVEMQLVDFSNMIHRTKFYAFHRFNTMVKKGNYQFDDLRKIYTITILGGTNYATDLYHQIGALRNQQGELIDDQITHVIVELSKFQKTLKEVRTDLDKLLYTMKLTETAPQNAQLPDFMREGWLEETLAELERANLTPEERADWEIAIARNMTEKYAREKELVQAKAEVEKKVRAETEARVKAETEARVKAETEARVKAETEETIRKLLKRGALTQDEIAQDLGVPLSLVKKVKAHIGS